MSQVFIPPFYINELDKFFDYSFFSCDIGCLKPEAKIYQLIHNYFDVSTQECLFIGDSKQNDFDAPISIGMNAFLISQSMAISQLLWFSFSNNIQKSLLERGLRFNTGKNTYQVTDFSTLAEEQQGRYNIVAKVQAVSDDGETRTFYCKRYLTPESARVEVTAYELISLLGMNDEEVSLIENGESLLMVSEVKGTLWEPGDLNPITAEQIGAYMAISYIIGNADIRPRNTFVYHNNGEIKVSIIDLEHCFFDRALDLDGLGNPLLPQTADQLSSSEIEKITVRRSLSFAMAKRARRAFVPTNDELLYKAIQKGCLRIYQKAQQNIAEIESLLLNKIYQSEPLIIGTKAHRRAMSKIDVNDILSRIKEDAVTALNSHY